MDRSALGKLIAVHGISPVHQQRAAVVAAVSLSFFIAMMIIVYARGQFGYFLLASGFLIVFIFTVIGWWMQRRNVVEIFDRGIAFKTFVARWTDISSIERNADGSIKLTHYDNSAIVIPRSVAAIDSLDSHISSRIGHRSVK